jgi:FixJ family two-component response regulator
MSKNTPRQDAPPVVGVIDPDPVARNGLRTLLHGFGIDVATFDSAESFLLASNGRHVGCLIVDLLLPGMSGLELLRKLRETQTSPPVIVLGEETDVRAAVDAMREGAADFIEKQHMDLAIPRRVAYLLDRTH